MLIDQNILNIPSNRLVFVPFYTGVRGNQRHALQPTVELTVMISVPNETIVMSTLEMFSVTPSSLALCDGTEYRMLPLQLNLVTPSFYQLGEHIINIRGSVIGPNPLGLGTQLVVNVNTDIGEYQPLSPTMTSSAVCFVVCVFYQELIHVGQNVAHSVVSLHYCVVTL